MTNIIYNFFLQKYFSQDADLEKGSYKLALFKSTYTPIVNTVKRYPDIKNFECEDDDPLVEDNPNRGYKKGGIPITFTKIHDPDDPSDVYKKYSCGDVVFNDYLTIGTKDEWDRAGYAIIYRESDELLVACFPFDVPITLNKEGLTLSWANIITIQISANLGITIDTAFDKDSGNPVQNRVITEALDKYSKSIEKYGIRLNNEEDYDHPRIEEDNIDTLNRIDNTTIDNMFASPIIEDDEDNNG